MSHAKTPKCKACISHAKTPSREVAKTAKQLWSMVKQKTEIAAIVVDAAIKVHKELGPGLLETVYEVVLLHELKKRGLSCRRQEPIDVVYDSITFEEAF